MAELKSLTLNGTKYDSFPTSVNYVKTINGTEPDENGNVTVELSGDSGNSFGIDTTLTIEGAAADAKAVGVALEELEGKISEDGGIAVTGATVGQTVKISAVDENGVPTAWESVDFPSGGGGAKYKLLASAEPITEPVKSVEVSIEADGITEIFVIGSVKQEEAQSYSYASIFINGKVASGNAPISENYESGMHYQGILLEGGHCMYNFRISQWGNGALNMPLHEATGDYGEQVKNVTLQHSGWQNFAVGTYFDVWGR